MSKKPYSLWKRKLDTGKTVYYVRFRLDDGNWDQDRHKVELLKTTRAAAVPDPERTEPYVLRGAR